MDVYALCTWRPEKNIRFSGTGVIDGFEPCELNLSLLEEQLVLLSTEPSLQPPDLRFFFFLKWPFLSS